MFCEHHDARRIAIHPGHRNAALVIDELRYLCRNHHTTDQQRQDEIKGQFHDVLLEAQGIQTADRFR